MSNWPILREKLSALMMATGCSTGTNRCSSGGGPGTHLLPCGHSLCSDCLAGKRPGGAFRCPGCNGLVRSGPKSAQAYDALTESLTLVWEMAAMLEKDDGDADNKAASVRQSVESSIDRMRGLMSELRQFVDISDSAATTAATTAAAGKAPVGTASGRKRGAAVKSDSAEAASTEEARTDEDNNDDVGEKTATPPAKMTKQNKRQSGRISVGSTPQQSQASVRQQERKTLTPASRKEQKKPQSATDDAGAVGQLNSSQPATPLQERDSGNSAGRAVSVAPAGKRLAKEARISQSPGLNYSQRSVGNIDKRNRKGETLLQVACIRGDLAKATQLLAEGADPNNKDNAGWTPLHECVSRGHVALARLLLENGANANVPGGDNDTPLHEAVETDHLEIARLLMQYGADADQVNLAGRTPRQLCRNQAMRQVLDQTKPIEGLSSIQSTSGAGAISSSAESAAAAAAAAAAARPPQLVSTGLSNKDRKLTVQLAAMLGGTSADSVQNDTTHLVTSVDERGSAPRTLKFLEAAALGRWIVSFEWVQQCANARTRVSEEPFEVAGTCTLPDTGGPRRSRLNRLQGLPPLLNGCHFHLDAASVGPSANPSRQELGSLISMAGGMLVAREPKPGFLQDFVWSKPFHAAKGSQLSSCAVVILFDAKQLQQQQQQQSGLGSKKKAGSVVANANRPEIEGVLYRSIDWLMDCLTRFELAD